MAEIVRGDKPCARCFRKPQEWLVISIGQTRWLHCWELKAIGGLADGVQKAIHFLVSEREHAGVAFQDFLVFEQQVITEHEPPFTTPEPLENLE